MSAIGAAAQCYLLDTSETKPNWFVEGFKSAADIAIDREGRILVPDMIAGTVTAVPIND